MTSARPEHAAGPTGPSSYEDTAEFAAAVGQLADPLSDPLPGRATPPRARRPIPEGPRAAAGFPEQPSGQHPQPADGSPWFRPQEQQLLPEQRQAQPYEQSYAAQQAAARPVSPGYPAPKPEARPEPLPEAAPEPQPPPVAAGSTAVLPVVEPAPPAAIGGRAERRRAARAGATTTAAAPAAAPAEGGRAARRQAAKRGRPRTPAAGDRTPATAKPPTSRVEARRAARAAKDSPGVIASRVIGEVFITIGVLMLLFVTYQLWWTNVLAHAAANGAANSLQHQWDGEHSKNDARNPGAFSPGQGFAIIYIPKLDVKAPIAEGVDKHSVLDKGMVGHYSGAQETAMPWDKTGNFALAGHRNTHGEPFRYINRLVPGDKVVVETESTFYTYQITSFLPQTSPANTTVIQPIPVGSGFTKPGRYITLTTCTPEFTSTYRMIVWGRMIDERPRSEGKPDALLR